MSKRHKFVNKLNFLPRHHTVNSETTWNGLDLKMQWKNLNLGFWLSTDLSLHIILDVNLNLNSQNLNVTPQISQILFQIEKFFVAKLVARRIQSRCEKLKIFCVFASDKIDRLVEIRKIDSTKKIEEPVKMRDLSRDCITLDFGLVPTVAIDVFGRGRGKKCLFPNGLISWKFRFLD